VIKVSCGRNEMSNLLRSLLDYILAPLFMYTASWVAGAWWRQSGGPTWIGFAFYVLVILVVGRFAYRDGCIERYKNGYVVYAVLVYVIPLAGAMAGGFVGLAKLLMNESLH
jgi:positive regulator of sigma E activity